MMAVTLVAYVVIMFTVAFGMVKKLLCDCKPTNEWDRYAVAAHIAFIHWNKEILHSYTSIIEAILQIPITGKK